MERLTLSGKHALKPADGDGDDDVVQAAGPRLKGW